MLRRALALALATAVITSCSDSDDSGDQDPSAVPSEDGSTQDTPTLLTYPDTEAVGEAGISGELGINSAGCFALDANVLVAPPGSTVVDDDTINMPGLGRVAVGDHIDGGGGYLQATSSNLSTDVEPCLAEDSAAEVAFLSTLLSASPESSS